MVRPSDVTQQECRSDAEPLADTAQAHDSDVANASLDVSNVLAPHAADLGQAFLAPALGLAQSPDAFSQFHQEPFLTVSSHRM